MWNWQWRHQSHLHQLQAVHHWWSVCSALVRSGWHGKWPHMDQEWSHQLKKGRDTVWKWYLTELWILMLADCTYIGRALCAGWGWTSITHWHQGTQQTMISISVYCENSFTSIYVRAHIYVIQANFHSFCFCSKQCTHLWQCCRLEVGICCLDEH